MQRSPGVPHSNLPRPSSHAVPLAGPLPAPAPRRAAAPTTAGTGSEVTRFTIITDETTDEKLLCAGMGFMPVAALIDYKLTLSLPARTTADTGIDALTHAIEAYVSRKANPYSDSQALAAMAYLGPNLIKAYRNGQVVETSNVT